MHTHTNASSVSTTNQADHDDGLAALITCGWKANTPTHLHFIVISTGEDSHSHTFVLSFGPAALGSPWNNHTHPISLVSCTTNASHKHTYTTPTEDGRCTGVALADCNAKASHGHPHLLAVGNMSGHTHTIGSPSTGTANAGGTPQNHTHDFSFVTADHGYHNHAVGGTITLNVCGQGANHTHAGPATTGVSGIDHTIPGTSGFGGESPTAFLRRLLVGEGL